MDDGESEYNCIDCDILCKSLNEAGRAKYDDLAKIQNNEVRCQSMAYSVMLNILTNNVIGVKYQLETLGSRDNCLLNYKLIKIFQKMENIGEAEGINYYRTWVEDDIWKLLSWKMKWKLYHDINNSWIWPTFAALIGISPMIFKQLSKAPRLPKIASNEANPPI